MKKLNRRCLDLENKNDMEINKLKQTYSSSLKAIGFFALRDPGLCNNISSVSVSGVNGSTGFFNDLSKPEL